MCEAIDVIAARTRTSTGVIAERTGLDYSTVYRIRKGERDASSAVQELILSALPVRASAFYKTMAKIAERRASQQTVTLAV